MGSDLSADFRPTLYGDAIAGEVGEKGANARFTVRPGNEKEQDISPGTPGCLIVPGIPA